MISDQVKTDDPFTLAQELDEKARHVQKSIAEKSTITTDLAEINIDCLESIFGHLDLNSLLSVSDTNKYVKRAAELVFIQRYRKHKFWLDLFPYSPVSPISEQTDQIKINGLKTCLQIVRCFGHLITNLQVTGDRFTIFGIKEETIRLIDYIIKYCSKFVTKITFEKLSESSFLHIKVVFPMVETVRYKYCDIKTAFRKINTVFPNLKVLELLWTDVIDLNLHIPKLDRLVIDLPINLSTCQKEHIETLIQLNPQLKSLKFSFFWNTEFLRSISQRLNSVENLEIICGYNDSEIYNIGKIHLNGVKNFKIRSIAVPKVTFLFDHLEEFTLDTNCWWTDENIELTKKYTQLTKLITKQAESRFRFIISNESAMKMAKALPSLKELVINYEEITVSEAIYVLKWFKSLDTIQFTMEHQSDFDALSPILTGKWTATVNEGKNVRLQRIHKMV